MAKEISSLKYQVNKWKYQDTLHGEGMIPLPTHRKSIKELREKWVEELTFQRFHWEKLQTGLKEQRRYKTMKQEKEQMYALIK